MLCLAAYRIGPGVEKINCKDFVLPLLGRKTFYTTVITSANAKCVVPGGEIQVIQKEG